MVEKLLGPAAKKMPDYEGKLEEMLGETTFLTNAGLDSEHRLNRRTHRLIRTLSGTESPTNRDVLKLYMSGVEKIAGRAKETPAGLGQKTLYQIEDYLTAIGILPVAYMQSTSRNSS